VHVLLALSAFAFAFSAATKIYKRCSPHIIEPHNHVCRSLFPRFRWRYVDSLSEVVPVRDEYDEKRLSLIARRIPSVIAPDSSIHMYVKSCSNERYLTVQYLATAQIVEKAAAGHARLIDATKFAE
jgi:hypothetical protein